MSLTRLFVGNLPDTTNEKDLQGAFSKYGQIVNVDFKNKTSAENTPKKFAFITISASNYEVESCIKHFSNEDFYGNRLFVSRARESFLERLQRERQEAQIKETEKNVPIKHLPKKNPVLKLSEKLNPRKRKLDASNDFNNRTNKNIEPYEKKNSSDNFYNVEKPTAEKNCSVLKLSEKLNPCKRKLDVLNDFNDRTNKNIDPYEKKCSSDNLYNVEKPNVEKVLPQIDKKKLDADKKRIESLKKKRQEFKEKQKIIKSGLGEIDKVANKKVIFSDNECDDNCEGTVKDSFKNNLFDGDESDDDVNFEIKRQYEGKKGQKVLDLQSRYKADKRFILDERFIEDDQSEEEKEQALIDNEDKIELGDADEKMKQLNILQDVLGVSIKSRATKPDTQKTKSKLGMLRFDPTQPEHAKFLAPVEETKLDSNKRTKKKKLKEKEDEQKLEKIEPENYKPKIEVSKEQFFKVSETLKEALEQPVNFSLRSLFGQNKEEGKDTVEQDTDYIPLERPKDPKVKNPLDVRAKNPFVYDSSDSELEVEEIKKPDTITVTKTAPDSVPEAKAVWKENLFFSKLDSRLQDGLAFFNKVVGENETLKERRELKSVMKKRIYNKERKNQMFQKKIGGRKKFMKKTYRKKN